MHPCGRAGGKLEAAEQEGHRAPNTTGYGSLNSALHQVGAQWRVVRSEKHSQQHSCFIQITIVAAQVMEEERQEAEDAFKRLIVLLE